jgi:hypothetical protein
MQLSTSDQVIAATLAALEALKRSKIGLTVVELLDPVMPELIEAATRTSWSEATAEINGWLARNFRSSSGEKTTPSMCVRSVRDAAKSWLTKNAPASRNDVGCAAAGNDTSTG